MHLYVYVYLCSYFLADRVNQCAETLDILGAVTLGV